MTCSVCEAPVFMDDDAVDCADWAGRIHHADCAAHCPECRGANQSERNRW